MVAVFFFPGKVARAAGQQVRWEALMSGDLRKPDDQHRGKQRAEARARLAMLGVRIVYVVAGALTLGFYLSRTWPQCDGSGCGLTILKGVIWGTLWPFYWMFYRHGFF